MAEEEVNTYSKHVGLLRDRAVDYVRDGIATWCEQNGYNRSSGALLMSEKQGLLEELFDKASLLRGKFREYGELATTSIRECVDKAAELWINYRPKPVDRKILAIDSGWNYRLYTGFYVYALKAAAVDRSMNIYHPNAEVGILANDPYGEGLIPDLVLKYTAEGYEHDIASRAADSCDLVLVDGSLIARLEDVTRRDSPRLKREYFANTNPLRNAKNIAFVSKYSHDKSLLGGVLGDIFYINMASSEVGYTQPFTVSRSGWVFSVFYAKLSNHANAIHVEVPAVVDEGFVHLFMDMLCGTAVQGYPYTLMVAHKVASLPNTLMEMLCKAVGLTGFQTAREVLGV
jgi:NurA domain.